MKCITCEGNGFTSEHAPASAHGGDGECLVCPIQVGCKDCNGTGENDIETVIGNMVRDFTKVHPMAKSEAKRRINTLVEAVREERRGCNECGVVTGK
jgi:hypothetical protein